MSDHNKINPTESDKKLYGGNEEEGKEQLPPEIEKNKPEVDKEPATVPEHPDHEKMPPERKIDPPQKTVTTPTAHPNSDTDPGTDKGTK